MLSCLSASDRCVSRVETAEVMDQEEEDFKAIKNMKQIERERYKNLVNPTSIVYQLDQPLDS